MEHTATSKVVFVGNKQNKKSKQQVKETFLSLSLFDSKGQWNPDYAMESYIYNVEMTTPTTGRNRGSLESQYQIQPPASKLTANNETDPTQPSRIPEDATK